MVYTKITTLERPKIEFGGVGDSVVHAIRLYKNAISTLTLQGPGKSLTGKKMFYTNRFPEPSGVKNTRPYNFWAEGRFFRFLVSLQ